MVQQSKASLDAYSAQQSTQECFIIGPFLLILEDKWIPFLVLKRCVVFWKTPTSALLSAAFLMTYLIFPLRALSYFSAAENIVSTKLAQYVYL